MRQSDPIVFAVRQMTDSQIRNAVAPRLVRGKGPAGGVPGMTGQCLRSTRRDSSAIPPETGPIRPVLQITCVSLMAENCAARNAKCPYLLFRGLTPWAALA